MSSEKLRKQNLIFILEDTPVSRGAQTDLGHCLVLRLSTGSCSNWNIVDGRHIDFIPFRASKQVMIWLFPLHVEKPGMFLIMTKAFFRSSSPTPSSLSAPVPVYTIILIIWLCKIREGESFFTSILGNHCSLFLYWPLFDNHWNLFTKQVFFYLFTKDFACLAVVNVIKMG